MDALITIFTTLTIISGAVLSFLGIAGGLKNHRSLGLWMLYATILFAITWAFLYFQKQMWDTGKAAAQEPPTTTEKTAESRTNRGLLRPGNDPAPEGFEACAPKGNISVLLGSVGVTTKGDLLNVIKIRGTQVLWFERTVEGMYANVILQNEQGDEVARVTKNAVQVRPESGYYWEMPDASTLLILRPDNHKALYLRYMNPSLMKVVGTFIYDKSDPCIIEEGKRSEGALLDNFCHELEGDANFIGWNRFHEPTPTKPTSSPVSQGVRAHVKWTDYTEDYFEGAIWRWGYRPEMGDKEPRSIVGYCPECGKPLSLGITSNKRKPDGRFVFAFQCRIHSGKTYWFRSPKRDPIEALRILIRDKLQSGDWKEVVKRQDAARKGRV